jgi:hypothetical protein
MFNSWHTSPPADLLYAGRLLELGPTTIPVEGCAIGICGGQDMTRIK